MRARAFLIAAVLVGTACSSADAPAPTGDDFLAITDCGELEQLASEEVDRINTTSDGDIVAAATARFEAIVAHRDALCG